MRAEVAIKEGDKLFLVTRRDLSPGYQGVQTAHAMTQICMDYPERTKEWFTNSNYLAWVSVADEYELEALYYQAVKEGLLVSEFREPDIGMELTAIAIEPHPATVALCKDLPLALKIGT